MKPGTCFIGAANAPGWTAEVSAMTAIPLHVARVGGHQLRFFQSPMNDGCPDFPWHSVDDLHRCLGLNREQRKFFLHKLKAKHNEVRTVATAEGIITVAPHFMAQGTVVQWSKPGERL
jgi:hypothetical protein